MSLWGPLRQLPYFEHTESNTLNFDSNVFLICALAGGIVLYYCLHGAEEETRKAKKPGECPASTASRHSKQSNDNLYAESEFKRYMASCAANYPCRLLVYSTTVQTAQAGCDRSDRPASRIRTGTIIAPYTNTREVRQITYHTAYKFHCCSAPSMAARVMGPFHSAGQGTDWAS
eukprot:scaffold12022_cov32-Prasinocladus_malaysianus.AAC.1